MANRAFNINGMERSTWSFTDANDKLLLVRMPKTDTFHRMTELQEMAGKATIKEVNNAYDNLLADILSNNQQGKTVTAEHIRDTYDFEQKMYIFRDYMEFVSGMKKDPN
jgi:hypothetical protein